ETGQVRAIERERRLAAGDVQRALPELEADAASDALLRDVEETVERLALRREPNSVVDKLGVTNRERLLQVRGFAIDGETFEFAMRRDEQRAAGSFVCAARFHADQTVFDEVGAANAVTGGDVIQGIEKIDRAKPDTIERYGHSVV